ncbi:MFS transporter [Paenibacillus sediminis]|uniref:CP family cyanate transporter-like MFS transporter n=1 Tax=Paenibacillus sediminis TaxID=664909 RepID=A0ABS4H3Y9_9BACL|nr:MFS transporter [Paenibacillus sediminis]MBP1937161.1 CP family cyanate transporter-like MFS transporter [Paenibacillus sediminis]
MDSQQLNTNLSTSSAAKQISDAGGWLLVLGIILIGANLRAPLTSVGPLVGEIRDSLGISNTAAGTITTLPLLAFALLSPFAPRLARRFGMSSVLMFSLVLLTIGIVLRSMSGTTTLFIGTALLGLAIAVCNVLIPSLVKQQFPDKMGIMTGVYSVSMNLCGAIASGVSVPLADKLGLGWNEALGCWGILALISIVFWIPQMRNRNQEVTATSSEKMKVNLWRSPLAWQVTMFMGLQSTIFYTVVAWFPEILGARGMSSNLGGWMLSLAQFAILPVTFIVPIWAARMNSQRLLVIMTAIFFWIGIGGLFLGGSSLVPLWAILIGIGVGFAFSLAMMFFGLRTQTTHEAAELSGMAQSVGYLLAAVGPTLFGSLHDATHSWNVPLILLLAASVLLLLFGLGAARNRFVGTK